MRLFTVNNVTYTAKPFDFNMMCELEDRGVNLEDAQDKPMSLVRAYFAISANLPKDKAGIEMQNHIVNGGDFSDVMEAMSAEMEESDFFRSLNKTTKEEAPKTQRKTKN